LSAETRKSLGGEAKNDLGETAKTKRIT